MEWLVLASLFPYRIRVREKRKIELTVCKWKIFYVWESSIKKTSKSWLVMQQPWMLITFLPMASFLKAISHLVDQMILHGNINSSVLLLRRRLSLTWLWLEIGLEIYWIIVPIECLVTLLCYWDSQTHNHDRVLHLISNELVLMSYFIVEFLQPFWYSDLIFKWWFKLSSLNQTFIESINWMLSVQSKSNTNDSPSKIEVHSYMKAHDSDGGKRRGLKCIDVPVCYTAWFR